MTNNRNTGNLYTCGAIEELQRKEHIECIDIIDGCLVDNFLLYDHMYHKYYMCIEHAQNEWSSCYRVIKDVDDILELWDKFKQEWEESVNEK